MFSRGTASTEEQNALKALSENDELFALPRSIKTTVSGIAAEVDPELKVAKRSVQGNTQYDLTFADGSVATITVRKPNPYGPTLYGYDLVDGEMVNKVEERPGDNPDDVDPGTEDVYLDASKLNPGKGGVNAYQVAATYAHNTGRIFIGDPAGLSDEAMRRRPEQMLSSALKFGTTDHIAPHPRQIGGDKALGIPALKWVYGDHLGNIKRLIDVNVGALENRFPDIKKVDFNADRGIFVNAATGGRLSLDALGRRVNQRRSEGDRAVAAAAVGRRTLARGVLLRSLLREASGSGTAGGGRDGLLARLVVIASNAGSPAQKIFYSRSGVESPVGGVSDVNNIVSAIRARWSNAPETVVVSDINDPSVPDVIRQENDRQLSRGATGAPEGVYYGGKVYLFSSQLKSDADVVRVLFHEALGHAGLRGTFGKELGTILDRLAILNQAQVREKAKQYGLDYDKPSQRRAAAEELLAEMAQTRPEIGWVRRAIAAIRSFLRTNVPGFAKMRMSDAEIIQQYILPARAWVEKGAGSVDGASPAFSRSAMKDVDANVRRGESAMNKAILEKADQARAMYRNDLGWIDFVWGDERKGIAHVIRQRQAKDGMTEAEEIRLLTENIVSAIARGATVRRSEVTPVARVAVQYQGTEVSLVRRNGANGWVITGFNVKSPDELAAGFDAVQPTQAAPTLARRGLGAGDSESVSRLFRSPAKVLLGIDFKLLPDGQVRSATQFRPTRPLPIRSRQESVAGSFETVKLSRIPAPKPCAKMPPTALKTNSRISTMQDSKPTQKTLSPKLIEALRKQTPEQREEAMRIVAKLLAIKAKKFR